MTDSEESVVDVVFDLAASMLRQDYQVELLQQVGRFLPWLETEPGAGIHPMHGAPAGDGVVLLPRRAKLSLRLARRRSDDALALSGQTLEIGGQTARVGQARVRELRAYGAIYSELVITEAEHEPAFLEAVASELAARGVRGEPVCGKRRSLRVADRERTGFSLLLHGLAPEHSLLLQRAGIGACRTLGCGVFVPHRLAAAVFSR